MNLSIKQKQTHSHRGQAWLLRGRGMERERLRVWDEQMKTITYRVDEQQGPTVYFRELLIYSLSCDKP